MVDGSEGGFLMKRSLKLASAAIVHELDCHISLTLGKTSDAVATRLIPPHPANTQLGEDVIADFTARGRRTVDDGVPVSGLSELGSTMVAPARGC